MDQNFGPLDALDKSELKRMSARSDAKGLWQLTSHLCALWLSGSLVWVSLGSWWVPLALLGHGIVVFFLFAPLHECVHRTAFRSRWLNDAVATACGVILVLPASYFRLFHFAHHRFTQDPKRDPELATPKPATRRDYLVTVSGLPVWREHWVTLLQHARGKVDEDFIVQHQRKTVVIEARTHLAVYGIVVAVSVIAASPAAVIYWVAPVLLGQPFLRMFLLAEHTGCPMVPNMLANSRTTISTPVVRWLAWHMPYHSAHHAYPAVPFHALPAAHRQLEDRVSVVAPGYVSVQREILCELPSG